jgi:hypothetical protein
VVAGLALILLAVLDTFRFHQQHAVLLLVCVLDLTIAMGATSVVYFEFMWWPHGLRGLGHSPYAFPFRISRLLIKGSAIVSAVTIFVDFHLGVAFYSFLQTG